MFTHKEIWDAIDRLAQRNGYSASGLAKKAGLDPTTFNKSKRHSPDGKPRWPSTESVAKILEVTGADVGDLMSRDNDNTHTGISAGMMAALQLKNKSDTVIGEVLAAEKDTVILKSEGSAPKEYKLKDCQWLSRIVYQQ